MNKSAITAAALAIVLTPLGVDAEILSQKRLSEILNSDAPGPVDVETLRGRDKDLLVVLGATLREKYGSILTGSEIVFTRTERAGRIVYRMDFLGVKTQDHAKGICEILEMENCVILSDDGNASLISAELDEDGLLSLDEYVPFSGPVRMQKMPASGPAWVREDKPLRLPESRPSRADLESQEAETAEKADTIKPAMSDEAPITTAHKKTEDAGVTLTAPEITFEIGKSAVTSKADTAIDYVTKTEVTVPAVESIEKEFVSVSTPVIGVTYETSKVKSTHVLPKERPSAVVLISTAMMELPLNRPDLTKLMPEFRMALPQVRPKASFGLHDHLPVPRRDAIRIAEGDLTETVSHSMISSEKADPLFEPGFSIVHDQVEMAAKLSDLARSEAEDVSISIPGVGAVRLPDTLPSIELALDGLDIDAHVKESDTGLEMEIAGIDAVSAQSLPRVFVLSFAEDGVKAFPNARVESASKSFEIAQVVMTDAFAKPFDVRGDGDPDLQKLPKHRPDLSAFDANISLVSATSADILLEQLLDDPIKVSQAPLSTEGDKSSADRLMERLEGMEGQNESPANDIGMDLTEDASAANDEATKVLRPIAGNDQTSQEQAEPEANQPDATAVAREKTLNVLREIATEQSDESTQEVLAPFSPKITPLEPSIGTSYIADEDRGIFDVADPKTRSIESRTNPELRIELSYATNRQDVAMRAKELEAYIPEVIMEKGRFYGYQMPTAPETYVIGIEAKDKKSREDIIWYLERMQIPWTIRRQ